MRSYWTWLSFLMVAWTCAFIHLPDDTVEISWRLAISALFFATFFLAPLFRQNPVILTIILSIAAILTIVAFWPEREGALNPYPLLVFSLLAGKAVYRLPPPLAVVVGLILFLGAIAPSMLGYPSFQPIFIALYTILLIYRLCCFSRNLETRRRNGCSKRSFAERIPNDETTVNIG
jgi:hypothetical protein